jgi:hypothetical protein
VIERADKISLSAQIPTCPLEPSNVTESTKGRLVREVRIHSALDQRARAHLDMEGELLVDFLFNRNVPEPRTQAAFHLARSSFDIRGDGVAVTRP